MKETMYIKLSHVTNAGISVSSTHEREVAHATEAFYGLMNTIMMEYQIPLPSKYIIGDNLRKEDGTPLVETKEEVPDIPLSFFLSDNVLMLESSPNHVLSNRGNSKITIELYSKESFELIYGNDDEWAEIQAEGMGHPYPVREQDEYNRILAQETAIAFGKIGY